MPEMYNVSYITPCMNAICSWSTQPLAQSQIREPWVFLFGGLGGGRFSYLHSPHWLLRGCKFLLSDHFSICGNNCFVYLLGKQSCTVFRKKGDYRNTFA